MERINRLIIVFGLALVALAATGCNGAREAATAEISESPSQTSPQAMIPASAPAPSPGAEVAVAVADAPGISRTPQLQSLNGQAGIWVSGLGKLTLEPDMALLNLGVEITAGTLGDARKEASEAMAAIVATLRVHGVAEKDVQTRYFNISPQYEWIEVIEFGVRRSKQMLVGYKVSNSASVKIRDMDAIGIIIDDAATAGGNATRIHGINFTVEDTDKLMVQLRKDAVSDALAKADQFARLTSVSLGNLLYISESGGSQPRAKAFDESGVRSLAMAAVSPSTSLSGGELDLTLYVQAVFAIQ